MAWNPQPIYFQVQGGRITASAWPDQIEVERSFLAMADPSRARLDGHVLTFDVDSETHCYRLVGDRGDGVLQFQRIVD